MTADGVPDCVQAIKPQCCTFWGHTGNFLALYTTSRAQLYGDAFRYLVHAPPNMV